MKLSSAEMMVEYRDKLKLFRKARNAVAINCGAKLVCQTWYHGDDFNLTAMLGPSNIRLALQSIIDHEIAETVRAIEAHGVAVDE